MPPRRRTFYLADATLLANSKVRRLMRHPDWLGAIGTFHILIGVATLNDSPDFSDADCDDLLGEESRPYVLMLRTVGLMTETGLDAATFEEWKPKPRPRYPSDDRTPAESDGITPTTAESDGVGVPKLAFPRSSESAGVGRNSAEKVGMPTSSTSSSSSSSTNSGHPQRQGKAAESAKDPEREARRKEALALHERYINGELTETEYGRLYADLGKQPDDLTRLDA